MLSYSKEGEMTPELEAARVKAVEKLPLLISSDGIAASAEGRFRGAIFLRDAAIFGLLTLSKKQNGELEQIREGVRRTLYITAEHQGKSDVLNPVSLEYKNRMPHEIHGPNADQERLACMRDQGAPVTEVDGHLEMVTHWALDVNALWNCLFVQYIELTGDEKTKRDLWPAFIRSQRWLNGQGLLIKGGREFAKVPINQWWKDSENSLIGEDGNLPDYPIAPLDVNSFAFLSDVLSARLMETEGFYGDANVLRFRALRRKELINKLFWMDDLKMFTPALDKRNNPVMIETSDQAIALWTGVIEKEKVKLVADRLLASDFLTTYGVRSRSRNSKQYNPRDYQNGNVWNQIAAIAAEGCEKSGLFEEAQIFDSRVQRLADLNFVELHDEDDDGVVKPYFEEDKEGNLVPVACNNQGWVLGGVIARSAA